MTKIINIMHILPSLEIGGMENGVVNLVNNLNIEQFRSSICCLEQKGPMIKRLKSKQIEILNINSGPGIQYRLPLRLAKLFRQKDIDIVHTHNFDSGLYGILGARLAGSPVIIHGEHGSFLQNSLRRNQMGKWICRMADHIVTMSVDLEKKIKGQWNISDNRISCILNGIDIDKFDKTVNSDDIKTKLGVKKGDYIIGTIGRLVPVKDYSTLLDSFALLKNRIQNACLIFVGDGPLRISLMEQVRKLGIVDDVKFLGTREDIPELLHIFDVFCSTSLTEGTSNTILEAMSVGVPVVATQVGGTPEIIQPNITGILVPPKDKELLTEALFSLVNDKVFALQLGVRAKEWIRQERSMNRMIQQYTDLYITLAAKKGISN